MFGGRKNGQIIGHNGIMGFSESQKEMVAFADCFIFADHRHPSLFGGRLGRLAVYLYAFLIKSAALEKTREVFKKYHNV